MLKFKGVALVGCSIFLLLMLFSCSGESNADSRDPQPIELKYLTMDGELNIRINKNMDRLEETKYQPQNIFLSEKESGSWPGDTEGRTILGLVLDAQATHREPKYLKEIIELIPQNLNEYGYMGLVYPNKMNEQQLSGNGWMLRGLCEYYEWKKDENVLPIISSIANNLFVKGKGYYSNYPIDPKSRVENVGAESGSIQNEENAWMLSSDIGCVFIGMEGLIHAYKHLRTPEIKSVIEEMIDVFLKIDLVAIKAQTHASLTACRGLIRYAEITGEKKYIEEVEKRWHIYKEAGMTENHENYNWFDRYDTWTEPCAIVDSYLLAVQLWQHTNNPAYRNDAELIYYNGICHTQRYNGGFGCDNCPGNAIQGFYLKVSADEAHWCCTMRGGEGVSKAAQYAYFIDNDTLIIPFYHESNISIPDNGMRKFSLKQTTSYPFSNKVNIAITENNHVNKVLKLVVPFQTSNITLMINGKRVDYGIEDDGFITLKNKLNKGDVIDMEFEQDIVIAKTINKENTGDDQFRIYYGPLLLGVENGELAKISEDDEIEAVGNMIFKVKNKDITLTPVYHLMDPKVWAKDQYRKQILF